jgi:hypothetical protein
MDSQKDYSTGKILINPLTTNLVERYFSGFFSRTVKWFLKGALSELLKKKIHKKNPPSWMI